VKITKKQLNQIIKEEIASIIRERQSFTDDELRALALKRGFKPDTDPSDDGLRRAADAKLQIRKWAEKEGLVEPQGPSSATLTDRKVRAIRDQAMKLEKSGNWRGALNLLDKGIKEVGNVFGTPLIKLQKELRAEYASQVMREEEGLEEAEIEESFSTDQWGNPKTKDGEELAKKVRAAIDDPKGKAKKGPEHNPKWHGGKY
jgi:hypothetical protein